MTDLSDIPDMLERLALRYLITAPGWGLSEEDARMCRAMAQPEFGEAVLVAQAMLREVRTPTVAMAAAAGGHDPLAAFTVMIDEACDGPARESRALTARGFVT